MNNSANGNMYEYGQLVTRELFGGYIEGNTAGICAVVCSRPLGETARVACDKTLHALGYGLGACAFVSLRGFDADADLIPLDAHALAALLEGLDPLCMIASDADAAKALAQAYGQDVAIESANRLVGRDVVAFTALDTLMESPEGKQRAWALFKTLPRYATLNRKKR